MLEVYQSKGLPGHKFMGTEPDRIGHRSYGTI